jgi:hypothetical protein
VALTVAVAVVVLASLPVNPIEFVQRLEPAHAPPEPGSAALMAVAVSWAIVQPIMSAPMTTLAYLCLLVASLPLAMQQWIPFRTFLWVRAVMMVARRLAVAFALATPATLTLSVLPVVRLAVSAYPIARARIVEVMVVVALVATASRLEFVMRRAPVSV